MSRLRSSLSAALTLSVALGVVGLVGVSASPAQADDTTTFLAVAAPGQTLDDPAVLSTPALTTLAVWDQQSSAGGAVVRTPQLRRKLINGADWTPVGLDLGGLDNVGTPYLAYDGATGRVLLTASASRNGALDSTLGTYLWWSGDDGATFSAPVRVCAGFGNGDAAPDGAGGFWTTTGTTGAYLTHVKADYTADPQIQLTDRVGSRGAMALTTAGPARSPVLAFQAGSTGIWAHRGTANSQALDTSLFPTADGLHVAAAGDTEASVIGAVRPEGTGKILVSRSFDAATGAAGPEVRVSPGDAIFFEMRPLLFAGAAAVYNDKAGDVWFASTIGGIGASTWSSPAKVLSGAASGVSYISDPDVSPFAVTGLGNRAGDSAQVVWVTATNPVTEKPAVSKAKGSYAAGKRAVKLRFTAAAPGKVKAVVLVTGATRKPLRQKFSSTVKAAGKVSQKLKLSKELAAQLAKSRKARITVKLTIKNSAGKDTARIKVRR